MSFLHQPHIPYACGMDSAERRNAFRTHTECIPHPMRNMRKVYHRISESVDTPSPLFLKKQTHWEQLRWWFCRLLQGVGQVWFPEKGCPTRKGSWDGGG